jgi:hypothetical protein
MDSHSLSHDSPDHHDALAADARDLASELAPIVRSTCRDRLGPISWFQSAWQRGGAATGYADWTHDDGRIQPVVVKLPVGYTEYFWTTRLSTPEHTACTPQVLAHGDHLGNYDLAWLVIERLSGKPLGSDIATERVLSLLTAACDLHARAATVRAVTTRDYPSPPNWERLLERAREAVADNHLPHEHRWSESLKKVGRHLSSLVTQWRARSIDTWCHGDLHPGNAIVDEDGQLFLIDLALVHAGHWVEDAVYLERQYWGHADFLHGVKPVSALAKIRRERGLETGDDYARIADVRRLLMASCVPALLGREGGPAYVEAALGIVERLSGSLLH